MFKRESISKLLFCFVVYIYISHFTAQDKQELKLDEIDDSDLANTKKRSDTPFRKLFA